MSAQQRVGTRPATSIANGTPSTIGRATARVIAGLRRMLDLHLDEALTRAVKPPTLLGHADRNARPVITVEITTERRSTGPIERLARQIDHTCSRAGDADEIAASLEAEGLNDRLARERYAHTDVFSLASEIHQRVPLRPRTAEPALIQSPVPVPAASTLIMRGPIYLIPILFFVASESLLDHGALPWVALPAVALAWVWNQGFGLLTHRLIGRGNVPGAHRMIRWSFTTGTVMVAFAGWLAGAFLFEDAWLGWFAAAQTAYLLAAAALVTLGRDRVLLLALAPGAAVMFAAVASGRIPDRLVGAAAVATVAAVVAAMLWATGDAETTRLIPPSRWEISLAGTHALLGATWAAFIATAGYAITPASDLFRAVSLAAAPMVVTMGVAESQIHRLRRDIRRILACTVDPEAFAAHSKRSFMAGLGTYSATLACASVIAVAIGAGIGALDLGRVLVALAFLFLGCASYAGMVLGSLHRADLALTVSAGAVLATIALITMARLDIVAADLTEPVAYLAGCLALCIGLTLLASQHIADIVSHR